MEVKLEREIKATVSAKRHELLNIIENFPYGKFELVGKCISDFEKQILEIRFPLDKEEEFLKVINVFDSLQNIDYMDF